jgi:uncharacterized membrane protein YphA (DoxX/SURF4 family)
MNIALWVIQALLALAFLAAGTMKVGRSKEDISKAMAWAKDFEPSQIKLIGAAELLGGLGLILPALTRILPWLTPLAGAALFVLMIGAFVTHLRLKELASSPPSIVLGLLSCLVAIGRFFVLPL